MEQFTATETAVSFMLWATDVLMAHQEGQAQKTHAVATALIYHKSDWESIHCDAINWIPNPILPSWDTAFLHTEEVYGNQSGVTQLPPAMEEWL